MAEDIENTGGERLGDNLKNSREQLDALNQQAIRLEDTFSNIAKIIGESTEEFEMMGVAAKNTRDVTNDLSNLAKAISGFNQADLARSKETLKFVRKLDKVRRNTSSLEARLAVISERRSELSEEEVKYLNRLTEALFTARDTAEELQDAYSEIVEANEKLNKETNFFDTLAGAIDDIPVIRKFVQDFRGAADAARDASAKGLNADLAGAAYLVQALGKALIAVFGGILVKGLLEGQTRLTEFSRQLNISRGEADKLNSALVGASSTMSGLSAQDLATSMLEVSDYLGISAALSKDVSEAFAVSTKYLGLSSAQASKLTTLTSSTGTNLKEFNTSLIGTTMLQNEANGVTIRYQDILKDVADTSAAVQLTTSKFSGGLQRAAFESRRLGLTMQQLEGMSQNLLDFESSIGAELEAELLTGKELTLERARMAALTGDQATFAQEVAKNFGTIQDFSKLNVLAQQAQAKALGMTREELAEVLQRQEALKKLGMSVAGDLEGYVKTERERIRTLREAGKLAEAEKAEKDLIAHLGETELGRQQRNLSMQESQALAFQKMIDVASKLAKILDPISKFMQFFAENAESAFLIIGKIGVKLKALTKIFSMDTLLKAFKGGGKVAGKALLKKIPVIGLIVGIGLGIKRMLEGDIWGGLAEIGSGALSLIPGLGTAASVAVDAGLLYSDSKGWTGSKENRKAKAANRAQEKEEERYRTQNSSVTTVPVEDFVIKPLKEDTISMAGGTKLGRTDEMVELLVSMNNTMNKLLEAKGDVYLDGNKVGRSLVLSTYKS